jgi:hypothetical protein
VPSQRSTRHEHLEHPITIGCSQSACCYKPSVSGGESILPQCRAGSRRRSARNTGWVSIGRCLHPSRPRSTTAGRPGSSHPRTSYPGSCRWSWSWPALRSGRSGLTRHPDLSHRVACTLHLRLRDIIPREQSLFGMSACSAARTTTAAPRRSTCGCGGCRRARAAGLRVCVAGRPDPKRQESRSTPGWSWRRPLAPCLSGRQAKLRIWWRAAMDPKNDDAQARSPALVMEPLKRPSRLKALSRPASPACSLS